MCMCCHLCVVHIFLLQVGVYVGVHTWAFTRQVHISVSPVLHNFWIYFLRQEFSCPYSHSPWLQWLVTTASLCYLALGNLNSDLHGCTGPVWITEPAPTPSRVTFSRWKHRLAFWIPTTALTLTWRRASKIWSYTEGSTLMFPYRKTWVKYWLTCCYPRHVTEDLSQAKTTYFSCRGPSSVLSTCEEAHTIHNCSW